MQSKCVLSGGKGNLGQFIDRNTKICAAGVPTAQPNDRLSDNLNEYKLQDAVDALLQDAIIPPPIPQSAPPLRRPRKLDMRNAGCETDMRYLINPPPTTKLQDFVEDLKSTVYASYWKKPLSASSDPVPTLPAGLDVFGTTFGKKTPRIRLYDVIMPLTPIPDVAPAKRAGVQINRNYCVPPYDSDKFYGHKTHQDPRGRLVKCCLTDDRLFKGTASARPINTLQAEFQHVNQSKLGTGLAPYNIKDQLPADYAFGGRKIDDFGVQQCMATCQLNPEHQYFKKCLGYLNSVRKFLSRRFQPSYFHDLYLKIKYFDKCRTGWLPKETVYEVCGSTLLRFNPVQIEPLLSMWNAFDGRNVEYKTFVHIFNYREPSPEIPKVLDVPVDCIDYRTTYREMVKPDQEPNKSLRAGLPSGRYFDLPYPITPERCCKADRYYLPQESDVKAVLCPSVLTVFGINHRDMFAAREPQIVRKVFEAIGQKFTDEKFAEIWTEAMKYHSEGLVCYETFRRVLNNIKQSEKEE